VIGIHLKFGVFHHFHLNLFTSKNFTQHSRERILELRLDIYACGEMKIRSHIHDFIDNINSDADAER
jgi:hypothetical protein